MSAWAPGAWATGAWTGTAWESSNPVEVPDVVGQNQAAATATIEGVGLVVVVEQAYSNTVARGLVISQQPQGGAEVTAGSSVTIVVSLGDRRGGGFRKYAAEIDGKWVFFDDLQDIEELVKEAAQEEAKSLKAKPRTKIKVQPGRIAEKAAEAAIETVEEQVVEASPNELAAQHALRQMYRFAYQQALKAIQEDEDDALTALLT